MHLTKSDFLKHQVCPSYFWLWKHKRDVVPTDDEETIKRRLEQGNEVERYARLLFPDGVLVEAKVKDAQDKTEQLVADGTRCIFQATAITDRGLFAMADVLIRNDDGTWTIYEVKSTNDVKPEHLVDATFQRIAFEEAGYAVSCVVLVHLDKTYVRHGAIEPAKLFRQTDITEATAERLADIEGQIGEALRVLATTSEPKTCSCRLKSKSNHCPTFAYLNPDIPEYSVFHITRLRGKSLELLVDGDILDVEDVPDDLKLSVAQRNQVQVAKTKRPIVEPEMITAMLGELTFPLYFLDYEAISTALPLFDGTIPYQQVPFQYSLHVLREPDGELEHYEHLARSINDCPMPELLAHMREQIGDTGSVIVWYQTFEKSRNEEMATMYPQYAEFLRGVNERVFDLRDVFDRQHFVHYGFNGRTSIKYVLPVLVPDLSYKNLMIQNGSSATIACYDTVNGTVLGAERDQMFQNLLEYCCLDTLAMVKIYEHLLTV